VPDAGGSEPDVLPEAVDTPAAEFEDARDPRAILPKIPEYTDEEIAEMRATSKRRRDGKRDRIVKKYGEAEAQLREADEVVPVRDTPMWYAVKVRPS
jgi:hypothetical protein